MKSAFVLLCTFCVYFTTLQSTLQCTACTTCVGLLGDSVAQTVTINPVGAVTVVEGNNLTITCTDEVNAGSGLNLRENGVQLIGNDTPPNEVNGAVRTFQLPVGRTKDGNTYNCLQVITAMTSPQIDLNVICEWNGAQTRQTSVILCIYFLYTVVLF